MFYSQGSNPSLVFGLSSGLFWPDTSISRIGRGGPSGRCYMDALGLLGSLGSLKELIPTLQFVGVYYGANGKCTVPDWKFGIATISFGQWSDAMLTPAITILIAPNIAYKMNTQQAHIEFGRNSFEAEYRNQFAAMIFTY